MGGIGWWLGFGVVSIRSALAAFVMVPHLSPTFCSPQLDDEVVLERDIVTCRVQVGAHSCSMGRGRLGGLGAGAGAALAASHL